MIVYCISGLGADERVFARLQLKAELRHIRWVRPVAGEKIDEYCKRLAEQVDASRPFVLLGVSFGGLVAREMAKLVPAEGVVIVSSFSRGARLPALARLPFLQPLLRQLPNFCLTPPRRLMAWLFGVDTPQEKQLLYQVLQDTDPVFLRWALLTLLQLCEIPAVPQLVHLHGTADRLIPCPSQGNIIRIKGGGHFMIYQQAEEVSLQLNDILERPIR